MKRTLTVCLYLAALTAGLAASVPQPMAATDPALATTRWNIASHLYLLNFGRYEPAVAESNINYAADLGFNCIRFNVWWYEIYPNAKALREGGRWYPLDHTIDYATHRGLKVIITLSLRTHDKGGIPIPPGEQVQDDAGRTDGNWDGTTRMSFSSPGFAAAIRFVQQVGERYAAYQNNGHILAISPLVTREAEIPYAHDTLEDFSDAFVGEFQAWLATRYANTIQHLNTAWDTRHNGFANVRPPRNFRGPAGRDWYLFRDLKARQFVDSCCAALAAVPGLKTPYRVLLDYGNVGDPMAWKRGSLSFAFHADNPMVIGVKHNDAHDYDHHYTGSLLGANMHRLGKLAFNEWFGDNDRRKYPHRNVIEDSYNEIRTHYLQGMNGVSYIGVLPGNTNLETIVARLKTDGCWDAPVAPRTANAPTVHVPLSSILSLDGWDIRKKFFLPSFSADQPQVNLLIDYDLNAPLLPILPPSE